MSGPTRVLVPGAHLAPGAAVALPGDEARHLRVSRAGAGEEVVLLAGTGGRASALLSAGGREAVVQDVLPVAGEPARRVTILLGVGEVARVEWAVEKGTECGAARFLLVSAVRSQRAHVAAAAARTGRLARIAAEAVKQCGRTVVPEVVSPQPLASALSALRGTLFVARPGAAALARAELRGDEATVAIGPEGGFDPAEDELLDGAGAQPIGLGSRVLRLETAVVAVLARLVDDDLP